MIKFFYSCIIWIVLATGQLSEGEKLCPSDDARKNNCSATELCVAGHCQCLPGYTDLNNECIQDTSNQLPKIPPTQSVVLPYYNNTGHSHLAIVIVVPVLFLFILIGSVVVVRKYNIVNWIRNKINQRDTPYDEVMIGQDDDDPPLSGV